MKTILAIDPGATGGLAVRHGTALPFAYPMPDTEGDVIAFLSEVTNVAKHEMLERFAVIENQTGCVGTKVSAPAMFKFGRGFGLVLGALQATGWRIDLVDARTWQKPFALGTARSCASRTEWKNKLKSRAQQLYPGMKVTLATADALLILEYWIQKAKPEADRDAIDAAFIRAGHKPEDRTCDHSAYRTLKEPRPRHCPKCGTCMWDAGD